MMLVSQLERVIMGVKDEVLDKMVDEIKSFLEEERVSEKCKVNLYKDFCML